MKTYLLNKKNIAQSTIDKFDISIKGNVAYFPVYNSENELLYTKYRYKGRPIMMPSGSHKALYGIQFIKDKKNIALVEGETDVLSADSIGITAISSTNGAGSIDEGIIEQIKDKNVYVCFDNDLAGHNGMAKVYKLLPKAKFVFLTDEDTNNKPKGDLNDMIVYKTPQEVKNKFNNAIQIEDGFVSHLGVEFTTKDDIQVKTYQKPLTLEIDDEQRRLQAKSIPFDTIIDINNKKKAFCPFHNDKNRSLQWKKDANIVKCFVCGDKAMDTIGFTMRLKKLKYFDAITELIGEKPKVYSEIKSINTIKYDN